MTKQMLSQLELIFRVISFVVKDVLTSLDETLVVLQTTDVFKQWHYVKEHSCLQVSVEGFHR